MENFSQRNVLDQVVEGGLSKVKKWIQSRDIDYSDGDGFTLLMVACNLNKLDLVEYLLRRKASVLKA